MEEVLQAKYIIKTLKISDSVLFHELCSVLRGLQLADQEKNDDSYHGLKIFTDSLFAVEIIRIASKGENLTVKDRFRVISLINKGEGSVDISEVMDVANQIVKILRDKWNFQDTSFDDDIHHKFREALYLVDYCTRQINGEPDNIYDVPHSSTFRYLRDRDQHEENIRFPKDKVDDWRSSGNHKHSD